MTKLSDTQRVILSAAAQHEMGLARAPKTLPAAARNAVFRSLIKNNLLTEINAAREHVGLGWRQDEDGTWIVARITDDGLPPAHEMIDPLKDTTALIAQVRAGFVPQPEAAGAFGYNFRAAVEMIREANALLDEAGISLDTDPRRVAKSGAAQDAAQMAAVEIAATGAAALPRAEPTTGATA